MGATEDAAGRSVMAGQKPACIAGRSTNPNAAAPSVDFLREAAAQQGVSPTEEDLQGVLGFLEVVLPRLAELEQRLPPETPA